MSENTVLRGIEQRRAVFAYRNVEEAIEKLGGNESKDSVRYKGYAKKIPALIKTNGLGATYAFIKSKDNTAAYALIYSQTGEWLRECYGDTFTREEDLVKCLISLPSVEYRTATVEVLALFNWLRRFAEGLIEGVVEDEN
jgi:CRISPR-associated protein Cmr5